VKAERGTRRIPIDDPRALPLALEILQAGKLVAYPTDTVYGLGALVHDDRAIRRLYRVKGRGSEKAIPILLASADDLGLVAADPPPMALSLARRFWPGALTLIVRQRPGLPASLSPDETIGVRVPDHELALALLQRAGPLATTSANPSGEASPVTGDEVLRGIGGRFDLLLDGGTTPGSRPSTVVDCTGTSPRIVRPGPISLAEIRQALGLV
jgi:L-threonylcarbamoyladenylate synthase